jgi:hypothetical protein
MLSLPDSWDYTLAGLADICKDGIDSVRGGIKELEQHGYLTRRRIRSENGQLGDIEYTILEVPRKNNATQSPAEAPPPTCGSPTSEKPICENPIQAFPTYGERTQSITNKSSIQESNTHLLNTHQSIPTGKPETTRQQNQTAIDGMDSMEIYREIIVENIDYEYLCGQYPHSVDILNEILELMLESVCTEKKAIRVNGEDKPAALVKSRMLKMDFTHIEYVLECMDKNTTDIRNIKSYLLTAIFNAPATIGSYYKARVNHDLYGGK